MPPFDHDEARPTLSGHPGSMEGPGQAGDTAPPGAPGTSDRHGADEAGAGQKGGGEKGAERNGSTRTSAARDSADRDSADRSIADRIRAFRPRSLKGATGLGIAGAAVLLFRFLDNPNRWWIPVGLGLGTLVLLSLLRLDHLLKGWTWHIAGLVLVAALVEETGRNPWAWALAASVGLLIAGLLRLPRWRILAVGAVACVLSIVGYQLRAIEVRREEAAAAVQSGQETRDGFGEARPSLVLLRVEEAITTPTKWQNLCQLLILSQDPQSAANKLLRASGAPSCDVAVAVLHNRRPVGSAPPQQQLSTTSAAPPLPPGSTVTIDGCQSVWGRAAPELGQIVTVRTDAGGTSAEAWRISDFAPCP